MGHDDRVRKLPEYMMKKDSGIAFSIHADPVLKAKGFGVRNEADNVEIMRTLSTWGASTKFFQ